MGISCVGRGGAASANKALISTHAPGTHVAEWKNMVSSSSRFASLFCLFVTTCALGCSGVVENPEELGAGDEALTGTTCAIGTTCTSLPLLSAVSYPNGGPNAKRLDVSVASNGATTNPRRIRQATTGTLSFARPDAPVTLKLRGSVAGAPVFIDDLLLFEVLSPTTGVLLRAGWAGGGAGDTKVSVGGQDVARLGEPGFRQDAGVVDLGALLPRDKPFRLRVSALDLGGPAYVSDVYADVVSTTPPPPPPSAPAPPWTVSACTGSDISRSQLLSRFAPASTTGTLGRIVMNARQRACQDLTGCADWQPASNVPFNQFVWTGNHYATTGNPPQTIAVPSSGAASLSIQGNDVVITLGLAASPLNLSRAGTATFTEIKYGVGPDYFVGSDLQTLNRNWVLTANQRVTNSCLFVESFGREYRTLQGGRRDGSYTEYHVVWSGTY
jgi:hypothetical protein